MDYQEKLRLAKKALDSDSYDKETIEYIFPELKESRDEKVKKAIGYAIGQSTNSDGTLINGVSSEEAIDWLEKQDKQKSADKVKPKFKVGDIISNNESRVEITGINERGYIISGGEIDNDANAVAWVIPFENQFNWELVEQKPTWSEEDERMFKNTIALIETIEDYNKAHNGFGDVKFWLKSLKEKICLGAE